MMIISYKPEVLVAGSWSSNSLRFATMAEADGSVQELMSRWWVPECGRASESNDPINYRFDFDSNTNVRL